MPARQNLTRRFFVMGCVNGTVLEEDCVKRTIIWLAWFGFIYRARTSNTQLVVLRYLMYSKSMAIEDCGKWYRRLE